MPNQPLGHDDFLDVLSVINSSQRGMENPHRIEASYSYDSVTGEFAIGFSDGDIAEALMCEGFDVEKQQEGFVMKAVA